ncbi:NAD(P)-binding protein [Trichoderma chlorosporum]
MASPTVVVFGPTGGVGSAAARTAESLGANVVLAMRDPSKAIPGLDAEKEKHSNFQRVQADLTQPDTVREAVISTGGTRAFIYCSFGSQDGMRATVEALKSAGIELVVFNSSYTVCGDLKHIQPSDVIPYVHARVEITLADIMGSDGFVAVRPGYFATNTLSHKFGLKKGEISVHGEDSYIDCIVPEDIGTVCGTILAKGPPADGNRTPYLYGPQLIRRSEVIKTIMEVLGKKAKLMQVDDNAAYRMLLEERGAPPPVAKYIVSREATQQVGSNFVFGFEVAESDLSNVEKYSGKKGTQFVEWVEQNKKLFLD